MFGIIQNTISEIRTAFKSDIDSLWKKPEPTKSKSKIIVVHKTPKAPTALKQFKRVFSSLPLVIPHKYKVILEYWILQQGRCPLCEKSIINPLTEWQQATSDNVPTIDHIIPVSRGGVKDIRKNGRVVHALCNIIRGNILDEEFNRENHLQKIKGRI